MTNSQEIDTKAISIYQASQQIQINTNEDYVKASDILTAIKEFEVEIGIIFDPMIKAAHDSHKASLAAKKKAAEPIEEAKKIISPKVQAYMIAQERIRKAEKERLEAEQRRLEEELRLAEAVVLEEMGEGISANEILSAPIVEVKVNVPKNIPATGIQIKETWSAEVVNMRALIEAVLAGTVPITAIEANMPLLNAQARSLKEQFNWPGCKAVKKFSDPFKR